MAAGGDSILRRLGDAGAAVASGFVTGGGGGGGGGAVAIAGAAADGGGRFSIRRAGAGADSADI